MSDLNEPEREEEEETERGGGEEEEEEEEENMWDLSDPESEEDEENMWHFNASPDQENDGTTSAAAPVASSSSLSSAVEWKYDVFLSFRGPDTRKGITSELYNRLQGKGIKTFMDDPDLLVGDVISPTLISAINKSRLAIVVLSQNYASSTWCLEELREICLSMEDNRILPLFYYVDPSDVRYQKRSFEDAFTMHESSRRHESEKVKQWKADLKKVANISGWNTNDYKTDRELVEVILESVNRKVVPDANLSTGDFEAYEATRKAMDEVMNALNDDKVNAVGVYGMGGVGKTAMVNHVGALAKTNGIFHHKIMAVVSQTPNFEKLQDALAEQLGFKFWEQTEIGRIERLNKEIMRREKLLIILDDVWGRTELSKIGIRSYNDLQKCKSKVLLTTRRLNVCHAMKCQKKIALNVLSEKDSWTLFLRNAGITSFGSTTFEDVARRVAGECRGLPIALIAVARALGDKDMQEWEKAAQRLEKSQVANHDHEEDAFKCIRLSYDYLKDDDSKSCFLLCCLFPEDSDIKIEELFKYAIGKGLFRDDDTIYEARKTVDSVVKYLKDSSLLLEAWDEKYVRMHDVIRDTALNIAKSEDGNGFLVKAGTGLKDWPCRLRGGYSAVSLMDNKLGKLPEELVCQKLQILLLRQNWLIKKIPETFFQCPNELSVLDLSITGIDSLPQSFSLLTNLQALYLDHCHKMTDISMLGKLTKLEILSMKQYPLKVLSREIGRLTNLRMLDISGKRVLTRGIVTIPANVISKLHRLEELYMLDCGFKNWGSKVEGEGEGEETNIGFDEIISLSNLKILQADIFGAKCIPKKVEVEPNWVYFVICIGIQPRDGYGHNSKSLILHYAISTLPDWFVKAATKKTEALKYECCESLSNMFMEYEHGRLHGLKSLSIYGPSEKLKVLMSAKRSVPKQPVFENLEQLHLSDLDCLKELFPGELPPRSLINLKVLKVRECPNFGNDWRWLPRLPNLEQLRFDQIDNMKYVFEGEGFVPEQSKLLQLILLNLVALSGICNGPTPPAMFPSLRNLVIHRCKLLQSVFTCDVAQCLSQLEVLWVEDCSSLGRIIEAAEDNKIVLPKLEYFVLKKLPKLLYSASATSDIECPSLKHLYVKKCPLRSFPGSASDYFHSRHQVQFNDQEIYDSLFDSLIVGLY